ncbi:MAG: MotA/TolQ/ExbB proton channel family protein, partial [Gammaproteobacteria bacterium]
LKIAATGQTSLDQVAGPIGEALIMTACGLAVAIPAGLAYNAFQRQIRLQVAQFEKFADECAWTLAPETGT